MFSFTKYKPITRVSRDHSVIALASEFWARNQSCSASPFRVKLQELETR